MPPRAGIHPARFPNDIRVGHVITTAPLQIRLKHVPTRNP